MFSECLYHFKYLHVLAMTSAKFKYLSQKHLLHNNADQEEDVVDFSESNLSYPGDISARGFHAQRKRKSYFPLQCLRVSVPILSILTILLIFLLIREHKPDQRPCTIKQSIYFELTRFILISPKQTCSRQNVSWTQSSLLSHSSCARRPERRLPELEVQWHIPGLLPLQRSSKCRR